MESPRKPYSPPSLILCFVLLSSLVAGCASQKKPWAPPPQAELPRAAGQNVVADPPGVCDEICSLKIAKEKIEHVKSLYNGGNFPEAFVEIESWTTTSQPWRNHLINSSGDLIIYLQLAVAYDRRDVFDAILAMDNGHSNATTGRIRTTATKAWEEYSKWLHCLYASQRQRNQCMKFETPLFAKVPEAAKLVE
jgi:hypothetical protein